MNTLTYQSERSYRLAFGAIFLGGMGLCTNGIIHTQEYGWLHPVSLSGILLGLLALVLGGSVLARRRLGPIHNDRSALLGLIGIITVKFLLVNLYPIFH
jgi:hypothetical protein